MSARASALHDGDQAGTPAAFDLFRAAFDSSPQPMLVIAADPPRFTMVAANEAHARIFRTSPAALQGRGVFEVFPKAADALVEQFMAAIRASLEQVISTGEPDRMGVSRVMLTSAEGAPIERYWSAANTPILDPAGAVTHIVSVSHDVTGEVQERRSEEARKLLMREVDHRARNALTIVQSLVRLSSATSLDRFRSILDGRIASLALAQTSLAARRWEGALLGDIVREGVAAIAPLERVTMDGPDVVLSPSDVQAMSMIVHELATNALKYGSLARPEGSVTIRWSREPDRSLRFVWREDGAELSDAPRVQGFGSRLVAQLVGQLQGKISYEWRVDGLAVQICAPARKPT